MPDHRRAGVVDPGADAGPSWAERARAYGQRDPYAQRDHLAYAYARGFADGYASAYIDRVAVAPGDARTAALGDTPTAADRSAARTTHPGAGPVTREYPSADRQADTDRIAHAFTDTDP